MSDSMSLTSLNWTATLRILPNGFPLGCQASLTFTPELNSTTTSRLAEYVKQANERLSGMKTHSQDDWLKNCETEMVRSLKGTGYTLGDRTVVKEVCYTLGDRTVVTEECKTSGHRTGGEDQKEEGEITDDEVYEPQL